MDRNELGAAILALEAAEEQLRPYVRAANLLQALLSDAADWQGVRDPEDTASEMLLALRRLRLPGPEAAAVFVASAVGLLEARP